MDSDHYQHDLDQNLHELSHSLLNQKQVCLALGYSPSTVEVPPCMTSCSGYQCKEKERRRRQAVYIEKLEVYPTLPYGRRATLGDAALGWGGGGLTLGP